MRKALIATGLAAALLLTVGCSTGGGATSTAGTGGAEKVLTLAPITDAQPWDLKDAGLGNNTIYYQAPYDSLMKLDAKAKPTPNLATEWKYTDAKNTTLALTLRSDVKFTNGEAFNAEAVKKNLENTKTGANEAAGQLKGITAVKVVDDTHVEITIGAPDPSFVNNLGSVAGMMMAPAAIGKAETQTMPLGSGPYVMDKGATTAGSQYTFTRNKDYWNKAAFPFDKVVFKPMTDPTARLNALRAGQIDGTLLTAAAQIAPVQQAGLGVLEYYPGDVTGVYLWDRGGSLCKPLANVKVRQAINYALDRAAIVKGAMSGMGEPTVQVFNPSSSAYDAALNNTYPYDVAKAKALLTEAGYPDGFTCDTVDMSNIWPQPMAAFNESMTAVGIKLNVVTVPPANMISQMLAGKFPLQIMSLASFTSWDTTVIQLKKDSLWNIFKYEDPAVTALIEKAQNATGAEQDAAFKEINKYIVDQAWVAPWAVVKNSYGYNNKKVKVVAQEYTPVPYLYSFTPAS